MPYKRKPDKLKPPDKQQPIELTTDFPGEDRHEFVAKLAYKLWEDRGRPFGSPEVDWFAAERLVYASLVASGLVLPSAIEPSAIEPAATNPSAMEPSAVEPSAVEPSAIERRHMAEKIYR